MYLRSLKASLRSVKRVGHHVHCLIVQGATMTFSSCYSIAGQRDSFDQKDSNSGTASLQLRRVRLKCKSIFTSVYRPMAGLNPMASHFGVGEFTTRFRLPILVVGLNRMCTGGYDLDFDPWTCELIRSGQ